MKLNKGVSIEIKKKRYTSEIPDSVIDKEIGKSNEKGILTEEGKAAVKRFRQKYEMKDEPSDQNDKKIEPVSKKVKKDATISPDGV